MLKNRLVPLARDDGKGFLGSSLKQFPSREDVLHSFFSAGTLVSILTNTERERERERSIIIKEQNKNITTCKLNDFLRCQYPDELIEGAVQNKTSHLSEHKTVYTVVSNSDGKLMSLSLIHTYYYKHINDACCTVVFKSCEAQIHITMFGKRNEHKTCINKVRSKKRRF